MSTHTPDEILALCMEHLPCAKNMQDFTNIRIAGRLAWEQKEMGGIEHVQFSHRNNTPIVPLGHCCHPVELVKRGYIDGHGWPKDGAKPAIRRVEYFKWPDGFHWYATLDGKEITSGKIVKFNSQQQAEDAAKEHIERNGIL